MKVLYISYDGMTDSLGQSQVLPYLERLSSKGYIFTILSFEKKKNYNLNKSIVQQICKNNNITWEYIFFHSKPRYISKIYDLFLMRRKANKLFKVYKYSLIHCRSYQSAHTALMLKKKYSAKYLFDMRGFWVDERIDGGIWDQKKWYYKLLYNYCKKIENKLISSSDAIISLTKAGKIEIQSWEFYKSNPISVIPTCADFKVFKLVQENNRAQEKKLLGFQKKDIVISYLGSLGTWYMLNEMFDFIKIVSEKNNNIKFLFITHDDKLKVLNKIAEKELNISNFKVVSASRNEVPKYLQASNINLFFIKPSYSKIASSPTKLGEVFSMGIPVICNGNVGDVEEIVNEIVAGGHVIKDFNNLNYINAYNSIDKLLKVKSSKIRESAKSYYDINNGVKSYLEVYKKIVNGK